MKKILAILVAAAFIPFNDARALWKAAATERIPNTDTANAFPRWMPYVSVQSSIDTSHGFPNMLPIADRPSIDVDSRNHAHVVYRDTTNANVCYVNDWYESRGANGFSAPFILDQPTSGQYADRPDIWIHTNDEIHVIWEHQVAANRYDLYYRKKTSGGWQATVVLLARSGYGHRSPQVTVDSTGLVHAACARQKLDTSGNILDKQVLHVTYNGTTVTSTVVPQAAPYVDNLSRVRLALTSQINVYVVWDEWSGIIGQPHQVYYNAKIGGSWGASKTAFGGSGDNSAPDIAIESGGNIHATWVREGTPDKVFYKLNWGAESQVSTIEGPAGFINSARVAVDSRQQVHVVWNGLSYGARVKNPDPNVLDPTWRLQEPAVVPQQGVTTMAWPNEIAFTPNDELHVIAGGGTYTRTTESRRGMQDDPAMIPLFGGAHANAANGNLYMQLPLFPARGIGPNVEALLHYNSLSQEQSLSGPGFRMPLQISLIDSELARTTAGTPLTNHLVSTCCYNGDIVYSGTQLINDRGTAQVVASTPLSLDTEYVMTTKYGESLTFNIEGKLRRIQDPAGNYVDLNYTSGRLTSIVDMLGNGGVGRTTTFGYETVTNQLYSSRVNLITDPSGFTYTLGYTGDKLTSVRFDAGPSQPTHEFEYYAADDFPNKARINMLSRYLPPRGAAAVPKYGYTCKYLPDNRLIEVHDPDEVYLLDGEGDGVTPTSHVAVSTLSYDETLAVSTPRPTWLTNRRGYQTKFIVEPKRSLVTEIHDSAVLAGTPGVVAVLRTFDSNWNLLSSRDRWGLTTNQQYFASGTPSWVKGNVEWMRVPKESGTGQDQVLTFTYTTDGFNNVDLMTATATPTDSVTPVSRTWDLDWNGYAQLVTIKHPDVTRPDGATQILVSTLFEYLGARKQLTKITNEEGHWTSFSSFHAVNGLPQSITREGGSQATDLGYTALGLMNQHRLPQGGVDNEVPGSTLVSFDGMHRVLYVTDPKGKLWTHGYDVDSNLTSVTPPVGGASTVVYDRRGLVKSGTTPDGSWLLWVDANGNPSRFQNLRGFTSNADFDFLDRVSEARTPGDTTLSPGVGGGGPAIHTTQFNHEGWDGAEHFVTMTRVGVTNRVTKTAFDNRGRAKYVLLPDAQTRFDTVWDELSQVRAREQRYGGGVQRAMLHFRDARQRVDRVRLQDTAHGVTPTNQANSYMLLNKAGSVVTSVDPLGDVSNPSNWAHKVQYLRDVRERVQFVKDGKNVTVAENVYGDDDLAAETKWPDPATKSTTLVTRMKYSYTTRKEVKSAKNRDNVGDTMTYGDLSGQLDTITNAAGKVTKYTYYGDTQRLDEIIRAQATVDEAKTKFVWTNGLRSETRVWNPATLAYNASYFRYYDKANRLERFETPSTLIQPERLFYNDFGEQSQFVASTKTITHSYNSLGQQFQSVWTGAYSKTVTRAWDTAGNLASVNDGSRERLMTWDIWKGTPSLETFKVGGATWKTQTHVFDNAGNYTSLTDPEGGSHQWVPDENNMIKEIKYAGNVVNALTFTPGLLPDVLTIKNASASTIGTTTYSYDGLGRPTRAHTVESGGGSTRADFNWGYNNLNLVTSINLAHQGATFTLGYNGRDELTSENTPGGGIVPARTASYVFDPAGNRTSQTINSVTRTFTHNAASQLTGESAPGVSVSHGYDNWGNENNRITGGTTESYGYNYLNRLSAYTNSSTGANWQYEHWPTGERYSKTDLSTNTKSLRVDRFSDDSADYQQIGAGSITFQNRYVQGVGLGSKATRITAAGVRRHYVGDRRNTLAMTLDDSALVQEQSVRDSWGVGLAGSMLSERYGYIQSEHDTESTLVNMRSASYDPLVGRTISRSGGERVPVKFPWLKDDDNTWWIRITTPTVRRSWFLGFAPDLETGPVATPPTPPRQDRDGDWILVIHSNAAEDRAGDIGLTSGHAWLTIHNARTGEWHSYGLWPDGHPEIVRTGRASAPGNLQVDFYKDRLMGQYYFATPLTLAQKQTFDTQVGQTHEWTYTNNCASFASDVFYLVTNIDIDADEYWDLESPREVGEHIIEENKKKGGCERPGTGASDIPPGDKGQMGPRDTPVRDTSSSGSCDASTGESCTCSCGSWFGTAGSCCGKGDDD